jgi:hypothetical protein
MSRLKMCLDGPCQASGVNRSVVDQTVPEKNRTILGIVDGTTLQPAEEAVGTCALGAVTCRQTRYSQLT